MPKGLIDKPYELDRREAKLVQDMRKWAPEGACNTKHPDPSFIAERTNSGKKNAAQEERAKAVCSDCPVKIECLDHALKMPERGGIWGGLNDNERDLLLRRLRKSNPAQWEFL